MAEGVAGLRPAAPRRRRRGDGLVPGSRRSRPGDGRGLSQVMASSARNRGRRRAVGVGQRAGELGVNTTPTSCCRRGPPASAARGVVVAVPVVHGGGRTTAHPAPARPRCSPQLPRVSPASHAAERLAFQAAAHDVGAPSPGRRPPRAARPHRSTSTKGRANTGRPRRTPVARPSPDRPLVRGQGPTPRRAPGDGRPLFRSSSTRPRRSRASSGRDHVPSAGARVGADLDEHGDAQRRYSSVRPQVGEVELSSTRRRRQAAPRRGRRPGPTGRCRHHRPGGRS